MNTPEDVLYQSFVDNLNDTDIDKSVKIQEKMALQQFDSVQIILNELVTSDLQINLNKQVEELWNLHYLNNTVLSSNDTMTLLEIACLDPIQYGSAVYQARSILDRDGNCQNSEGKAYNTFENPKFSLDKILLFPNPAQSDFTVKSLKPMVRFEIFSMTGYSVSSSEFNSEVFENKMDLPSGIYIVEVLFEDGTSTKKKIVIQ